MSVDGSRIRVTAMVVLPSSNGLTHAVQLMGPTRENPRGFHRLIGGGVEFGETTRCAAVREVREELGAELAETVLLGFLENLFEVDGMPGHELAFVYTGRLDPVDAVPVDGGMFADNGVPMPVQWRPIDDTDTVIPLYPNGAGALARQSARGAVGDRSTSVGGLPHEPSEFLHSWRGDLDESTLEA